MTRNILLSVSAVALLAAPTFASADQQAGAGGGFAAVGYDGTLRHGMNVTEVKHLGAGSYRVHFNNDISKCSAQATVKGRSKKSLVPAYIVVGAGHDNSVRVATFATVTLVPTDFPFNLTVTCG